MIGNTFQFEWEVKLIEWCQTCIPSFIIEALNILSYVGDTIFLVAILGFLYLCYDKKAGRKIFFNTIINLVLATEIKNVFKRRRPYFDNENVKCLKIVDKNYDMYDVEKQGYSLPSMHSANITTITGSMFKYFKKNYLLVISIVVSFLVGISRFVLGCHYPTDVLIGWALGIFAILVFGKLQDILSEKAFYILVIIICSIGCFYCESADYYTSYGIVLGFIGCVIVDDKYINFKNTRNIVKSIARVLLACGIFLVISEGLKLLLPESVLEANTLFAHIYRTIRYGVSIFVGLGLTPALYKFNILKLDDKL